MIFSLLKKKISNGELRFEESESSLGLSLMFEIDGEIQSVQIYIPKILEENITRIVCELSETVIQLKQKLKLYESILFPEFINDSTILKKSELDMILTWINITQDIRMKRLYKGSIHGDSAENFHKKVDGICPTITFVETLNGFRLGGFTTVPFDSYKQYKSDPAAFIFSIDRKRKFISKDKQAIYCNPVYGPTFGEGHDIYIANNYLGSALASYSKIWSYGEKKQFLDYSESAMLAGGYYFLVKDVEVFQVIELN
jgi:hypothetical protein